MLAKFNEFVFRSCSPDFFLALFVNELACLKIFWYLRNGEFHKFLTSKTSFEKFLKSLSRNESLASLQFSDAFGRGL